MICPPDICLHPPAPRSFCPSIHLIIISLLHFSENRLKKLKGQSGDVTSREMLRSLSQAKKECWDRFLHDVQTSELFQGSDMDERWDAFGSYVRH